MSQDRSMHGDAMAHARCWNSLPWYVNGTLAAEDVGAIERHVAQCAECAAELNAQRALQAHLRDGAAVLMAPQSSWSKMAARLDGEDDLLMQRDRRRGRTWRMAVAAQALVIVGMASVIWWQALGPDLDEDPQYRTLTANSSTRSVDSQGVVRVVFSRDAALVDVNSLLHELQLEIVSGPSEANVYVLTPTEGGGSKTSAQDLLKTLRADARVVFAEPSL